MAVILVYDWDFFHYPSVLPNLECAKYAAWRKKHRDIVVFHNELNPGQYTKTFLRKEYDDGVYDKVILNPTVEYGGRAFSEVYRPFDLEMERIEPDMWMYWQYKEYYTKAQRAQEDFKAICYATNVRLSLDGKKLEPFPYDRLKPRHPNVLVHDYDLANVPGAFELLEDISKMRPSGLPYRIGNKYPINVYTYEDLQKWLKLPPMSKCFYLQFNGQFTDEQLIELVENPVLGFKQVIYNFTYGCRDEDDFTVRVLPHFYKQLLFLRSHKQKILLNIDTDFFQTRELLNLIKLLNCFYGKSMCEFVQPQKFTLYGYCAQKHWAAMEVLPWVHFIVSREEMRESFQYMRKHNYEVFDMFYSIPNVIAVGGKLVNEWERNKRAN